jgi:hypothetical protein
MGMRNVIVILLLPLAEIMCPAIPILSSVRDTQYTIGEYLKIIIYGKALEVLIILAHLGLGYRQ